MRKGHPSFHQALDKLPYYLSNYFNQNSFLIVYPKQLERNLKLGDNGLAEGTYISSLSKNTTSGEKSRNFLTHIFGNKKW